MTSTRNRIGLACTLRAAATVAAIGFAANAMAGPLDTLAAGRWYSFPNSHMETVAPSPSPSGSVGAVMNAWSGGVYDTDRDQLVVWGGGHVDYAGNEVYAFGPLSSDSPSWKRLTNPSNPAADNTPRGSDGRPVSRHTYNLIDYMPAPLNKMASCAVGSQYSNGYGVGGVDFFDFTVNGLTGQPWSAGPTAPSNTYALESFCAFNPVTQRLWYQDNHSNSARLQQYNPSTNQWTSHAVFDPGASITGAIDTKRNLLVAVGGGKVIVYNLNSPNNAPAVVSTSGPTSVQGASFPGFVYDPVNDQFVGWSSGNQVYALAIPANAPSGTWAWSQIPLDSGNSVTPTQVAGLRAQGYVTGTFGRFRYVPSKQGVILVNAVDENVFFFKLPNNGGKPLPSINLNANPTAVPDQGTTTLTWSTTNATSCTASGSWAGAKSTSGSESIGPITASSTYILTCDNGNGGTNNRSVTVTVATSTPAPTVTFNATPTSVSTGGTSVLAWTTSSATSCTGSGSWSGSKGTSGSTSVGPLSQQASYTLTCTGSGGTTAKTATVSVVGAAPAPIVMLSASPTTIASGANSTLTWSVTNATACTASNGWTGSKSATTGTQAVGPLTKSTTFLLSCTGAGGTGSNTATVTVTTAVPPPPPAPPAGGPAVTLTATPTAIDTGDTTTLSWNSTNATSCTASGGWSGTKATSGTEVTAELSTSTDFTLTCAGTSASAQSAVSVSVTAARPPVSAPVTESSGGGGGSMGFGGVLGLLAVLLRRLRAKVVLPLLATAAVSVPVLGADLTTVSVISQTGSAQTNVPVTFGQAFKPGDVPSGTSVRARLASGADLPLQVDAKATNADGSLRHAVLTAVVPSLGANASQVVTLSTGTALSGTAVSLSNLLATSFNASVSLQVGSTTYTASAREALAASPTTWLSGPLASEWIAKMPVKTSGGAAHPHLTAYFHVRAYAGNPISQARVDVVIENNWTMVASPATQTYNVTVTVPGATAYSISGLSHYAHTRWHKRMWWGTQPAVYAKLDKDYLQNSRAIPKYENVQPTDGFLNGVRRSTAPMSNGDQTDHMDDTGYQEGIGPLPRWDAVYAVSTDVRAFDYMLANADGGTAYSIHLRDETTGLPVTIDKYPNSSLTDPQSSSPVIPMGSGSPHTEGTWSSHQPSIGYTAYLVTGDYFYLEEAQFWSSYNLIWPSTSSRGGNAGYWYTGSLRGQAWAYRSLAQSAYITPDNHPLKAYYVGKLANNIQHDIQGYVSPGGPYKNNLGAMYSYDGNEQYRFFDYFMSWTVQYLVDLGFTDAVPFRDYKVKFPIGLMGIGANDYCYQSAAQYTWKVGPVGTSTFYPDFKTMYQNTAPTFASVACDTSAMASAMGLGLHEMSGDQASTTYYFANLQPALAAAYDSGVSGGQQAWQRSQLSGKHPDYRDNPIWAIVPRGAGQSTIQVTLSANPTTITPGSTTTLTWSSTNADSCTASNGWTGSKATSGTQSVGPLQANATYVLTCTSSTLGTASSTALVTVSNAAAPTVTLTAAPTSVASGASSTLTWSSTNATSCTASGNWTGSKATSGTQSSGALTANATYTLSCTGAGGSAQKSATVTVTGTTPPPSGTAPTVTLTASPASVVSGGSSTLTWTSTNATGCTASGTWSGAKTTSGSASVGPLTSTSAFALNCTGGGGSAQKSVTVMVTATPPTTPAPTVTLSANPTAVDAASTSTLTWSSTNATACEASAGWDGVKAAQGSQATAAVTAATTYTLSCSGDGGSTQSSVTVSVNAATPPPATGSQESGGGGGAMGYATLLGLLGVFGLRQIRRRPTQLALS